ncbi:MAG: FAD-dependent oxidoreductase [Candidatus Babeliales bacterium]
MMNFRYILVKGFLLLAVMGGLIGMKAIGFTKKIQPKLKSIDVNMHHAKSAKNVMPVAIIGSGPAALSAAVYSARARIDTLVIQGNTPGGALMGTSYIENWPSRTKILGKQVIDELTEQAKAFGATFLHDTVSRLNLTEWPYKIYTEGGHEITALSVVIATGSTPLTLGVPGEQEYWGKGVTTCAICDAPFHKDNDVVVIGGGDSAIEEAMQLAPYAKQVTILVRKDHMRAAASMQERLKEYSNVCVRYNVELKKIIGENDHVSGIQIFDNKNNHNLDLPVQGVFLAIGHEPNTELFKEALRADELGYLSIVGRTQQTSMPGVFAAGDVQDNRYKQAGVAAGDGIKAALDAVAFLQDHGYSTQMAKIITAQLFDVKAISNERLQISMLKSNDEFQQAITKNQGPVVLDFYADYCPSCMRMLPDLEVVAHNFADQVTFYKVDMDSAQELATQLHVKSIPTLLVFEDGQLIGRYNEAMNKKQLHDFVGRFIKV